MGLKSAGNSVGCINKASATGSLRYRLPAGISSYPHFVPLAQLVELLPFKQGVEGSRPSRDTPFVEILENAERAALWGRPHPFDSEEANYLPNESVAETIETGRLRSYQTYHPTMSRPFKGFGPGVNLVRKPARST